MTQARPGSDDYDLKQCGRCAAWIPRVATMCAYCGSSSPDARIDPRPARTPLGLPRYVTVTRVLIAANLLYFLFSLWAQKAYSPRTSMGAFLVEGHDGAGTFGITRSDGVARPIAFGLWAPGAYDHDFVGRQWWRTITAAFLHGGIIHLALNMFALKQLGHIAEELFGGAKLLAIYVVCAISGCLAGSVWSGVTHGGLPPFMVGASGAIFGVGGLLTAFLIRRGSARGRAIGMQIGQNLLLMLALGFFIPFVSNTGHVGGMIPGLLFGLTVRESFSTQLSPQSRRNWWLAAAIAAVITLVALGSGAVFTIQQLGGRR